MLSCSRIRIRVAFVIIVFIREINYHFNSLAWQGPEGSVENRNESVTCNLLMV